MVLGVEDLVVDVIGLVVVVLNALQVSEDASKGSSLVVVYQAFDVFEYENGRKVVLDVRHHCGVNEAASLCVLKAFPFPGGGKGLAWKPCHVNINMWCLLRWSCSAIIEEMFWCKIFVNGGADMLVSVAAKNMVERNAQVVQGLDRRFHP